MTQKFEKDLLLYKFIITITIKVSSTIRNSLGRGEIVSYIHVPYIHAILHVRMTIVNVTFKQLYQMYCLYIDSSLKSK